MVVALSFSHIPSSQECVKHTDHDCVEDKPCSTQIQLEQTVAPSLLTHHVNNLLESEKH